MADTKNEKSVQAAVPGANVPSQGSASALAGAASEDVVLGNGAQSADGDHAPVTPCMRGILALRAAAREFAVLAKQRREQLQRGEHVPQSKSARFPTPARAPRSGSGSASMAPSGVASVVGVSTSVALVADAPPAVVVSPPAAPDVAAVAVSPAVPSVAVPTTTVAPAPA
ncbi:MAG: hypothetical protein HQL63_10395, partial [Magnetococcales bacterium]|nr:hypothetical protein [Magnetococcales bacterium]